MRIGFNTLFLERPETGSGQYTRHLLEVLAKVDPTNEYLLFGPGPAPTVSESQLLTSNPSASLRTGFQSPISNLQSPTCNLGENLAKLWFEQVSFPRACRHLNLAHVPYFASPLFPTVPTVVTIHDLIPLILPAYRGAPLVRLYTRLVAAAARKVEAIITVSQASGRDIVRYLHIPSERIHVTYEAAGETFQPVEDEDQLAAIRQKYALPERYLLYLGGFDQRKNLPSLLRAFALLVNKHKQARLVIAGQLPGRDSPLFPDPRRLVRELDIEERVIFTGWMPEEDKPALLSGATAFVFPSLYEGFGLPPAEALACGTPVIASNRSSLPEVVGEGGILVEPTDVEALAEAMEALLVDGALRAELRQKALAQATRFSWRQTALKTLAVYREVVEECAHLRP
jgi:glycosyltransferase involved in cell wall biosynthesis